MWGEGWEAGGGEGGEGGGRPFVQFILQHQQQLTVSANTTGQYTEGSTDMQYTVQYRHTVHSRVQPHIPAYMSYANARARHNAIGERLAV